MLNFFKRKKEDLLSQKQMLLGILALLPDHFKFLIEQINDGLILSFRRSDSVIPNYHKVVFNITILNKYEIKKKGYFRLIGPEVFDLNTNKYVKVDVFFYSNILQGYATPTIREFRPDSQKIKVSNFYLQSLDSDDFEKAKALIDKITLAKLNPNDIYALALDGKTYYHLKDLEDGDFIGIDEGKKIYKITHDPYGIVELNGPLTAILERRDLNDI